MVKLSTAIILAGGKSSRMGFSKEFMNFNGRPLMDQLIEQLSKSFEDIIVVTKHPDLYTNKENVTTTFDIFEGRGPLGGLHAGLAICKSDFAYLLACDMPYVNKKYIDYLKDNVEEGMEALVAKSGEHIEPFNGFYNVNLFDKIEKALLNHENSMNGFIRKLNKVKYIDMDVVKKFSEDLNIFININTRERLMELQYRDKFDDAYDVGIRRIKNGNIEDVPDMVINECPLTLHVNNKDVFNFLATPHSIEYLVVGHLFVNRYIDRYSDIKSFKIDKENLDVYVETVHRDRGEEAKADFKALELNSEPVENKDHYLDGKTICDMSIKFENMSGLFAKTGGAHSCAIIEGESFIAFEEDVSRNNCVDKMIGRILKDDIDMSHKILMTSCRISGEIMSKIVRAGINSVVSVAAVTSLAVELAQKYNVTLLGFTRGNRFNIYTNKDKVK